MGKKEKYGNYLCKVGYFDIRQKIEMPRKRKLNNGEIKLARTNKNSTTAIDKANEMLSNGIKYDKFNKS